ncbi:MAG: hypothetical protein CMJ32_07005 [Phycisphaerae bacterium]|nr:hypothetical protein [Phycisphaerae bacterium]
MLFSLLILAWLACVLVPLAGLVSAFIGDGGTDDIVTEVSTTGILLRTLGWSAMIAAVSASIGWIPGRYMARARGGGCNRVLWILMVVPMCLPAYAIFYCWYQAVPPGSYLGNMAAENGMIPMLREGILLVSMTCWSWPIISLCVAACTSLRRDRVHELLTLDAAGPGRRLAVAIREDLPALLRGMLIVGMLMIANTVAFDLAQVQTMGFHLRALEAQAAPGWMILQSSLPLVVLLLVAIGLLVLVPLRRSPEDPVPAQPPRTWQAVVTWLVVILTIILPIILLGVRVLGRVQLDSFISLYGRSLGWTVLVSLVAAIVGGILSIAMLVRLLKAGRNWCGTVAVFGWLLMASIPGILLVVGIESAYNRPWIREWTYDSSVILLVGLVGRFGFIAVLVAWWIRMITPESILQVFRSDGVDSFGAMLESMRGRMLSTGLLSGVIIFVMSMGEVVVTAGISPPGGTAGVSLPASLLNAMHYQEPDVVISALWVLVVASILVACLMTLGLGRLMRRLPVMLVLLSGIMIVGCDSDPNQVRPIPIEHVFGSPGSGPGQFNYPRSLAMDGDNGWIYVVDKNARIQKFDLEGTHLLEWSMPQKENGKPTGLHVGSDGSVYVADTHYFRIIRYDPDGREISRFGSYGTDDGEFIYTTDLAVGPGGRLYVSEYGGNDRVQVFEPDGRYLFGFGSQGSESTQFNRPQSIGFSHDKDELYVADACNHRIVVTDPDGQVLRILCGIGREPGQLCYPYNVLVLPDGNLMVAEFGNNRIQKIDVSDGRSLGIWGGLGFEPGRLQYPWSLDGDGSTVAVLDSGNNRVALMESP